MYKTNYEQILTGTANQEPQRYTPTLLAGMSPYPTGLFIRHCDYTQIAEAYERKHHKTLAHVEVVTDQLERMQEANASYLVDNDKLVRDNIRLLKTTSKLVRLVYLVGIGGGLLGSIGTFLGFLITYN